MIISDNLFLKEYKAMKKTYFRPAMDIIKIQTSQMLAASLPMSETEIENANEILAPELPGIPPFVFE